MVASVSPDRAMTSIDHGESVQLLDVRTPAEFRSLHAAGARNIPLDSMGPEQCRALCTEPADGAVYLICKSGARARAASAKLAAAGRQHVYVVEGGTDAWERAGLPVERGAAVMSLERQVRIAAGVLVALGAGLALLVHPAFAGLSLFVGCGLIFSGVTDTCGMGMLLSKMPWNKV